MTGSILTLQSEDQLNETPTKFFFLLLSERTPPPPAIPSLFTVLHNDSAASQETPDDSVEPNATDSTDSDFGSFS